MNQNNKANLWLRTICVTVALLGMLFFTHSQLSIAAPATITLTITASDTSGAALDADGNITFRVEYTFPGGTDEGIIISNLYYTITSSDGTVTEHVFPIPTSNPGTKAFPIEESTPNGVFAFVAIAYASSEASTTVNYTSSDTQVSVTTNPSTGITIDTVEDIADVTGVDVEISSSGDDTDVLGGESVNVDVNVDNAVEGIAVVDTDAVKGDATDHTLQYKIAGGASTDLDLFLGDNNTHFTGMLAVDAMTPAGAFTFESVTLSLNNAHGDATAEVRTYTTTTTSTVAVMLTDAGLTIDPKYAVTDVTSVAVDITSSGDDTAVSIGESVTVDVNVGNAAQGIAVVDITAVKGDTTAHKLLYKIGESGVSIEVALLLGDSNTHFTVTLPAVADGDIAGAFTFESVTLSLQNGDGNAVTAKETTYTVANTSILTLTDPGLTIDPSTAVADITSVAVSITGSGDGTDVTLSETVNVDVIVVNAPEGVAVVADDAHTLQYKIGASGASTDLALLRGDNDTHFTAMLAVDAMTPAGVFTFESVTLSLQNGAGNAITPKKITYSASTTIMVGLTDAVLTLDPTSGVLVLANVTAVNNTAGVGDKVTFTAWITNSTDDKPLNVTVNYKITGTKTVTGSVILAYQGLSGNSTTVNLWNGTLTIPDNATAGNLTIESIVVWLMNTDSSETSRTISAAGAKATNVVNIDIPAPVDPPVDPPTTNTTTSATAATTASASTSASSSESSSDSPVSIFAMFILIASVSMAVGVYTLRRRQ